jgi:ParB family transcriptional regulator, chromosome partitioning protein
MTRKSAIRVSRSSTAQTEEQTTPASSSVQNIYLSQLVLSPANIRTTPATTAEDAALEASIRAKGILQNLIVHAAGADLYEVDAGGRRLKILQKLAVEGAIDANRYEVPCTIKKPEDAVESSLAENTIRAAMIGSALQMSSFCSRAVIAGL